MYSPNSGVLAGGNFNVDNPGNWQYRSANAALWQAYFRNNIRYLVDVLNQTKADPNRSNLYNMVRIWKAYSFMVLTDSYGDIPYTEAGLGYIGANVSPKYDTQESIYNDLIKELTEASAALDAAKPTEAGEVAYGGTFPAGNDWLLADATGRHAALESEPNPGPVDGAEGGSGRCFPIERR